LAEPFDRVTDTGTVNAAGADATDDTAGIERTEGCRLGIDDPGSRDQEPAEHDYRARPEAIGQIRLERHQPGLEQHEERKGHLDGRLAPVVVRIDRLDEDGPAVLQVRDHRHAHYAGE